jgi:hypothetical protein
MSDRSGEATRSVLWSRWSESSSELDTEGLGCVLRDLVELESLVSVTDFSRPAVLPPRHSTGPRRRISGDGCALESCGSKVSAGLLSITPDRKRWDRAGSNVPRQPFTDLVH